MVMIMIMTIFGHYHDHYETKTWCDNITSNYWFRSTFLPNRKV